MQVSFDAIFFILFGMLSLIAGLLKKKILFWVTIKHIGIKNLIESKYAQIINIIMGIISILIGVYLLKN